MKFAAPNACAEIKTPKPLLKRLLFMLPCIVTGLQLTAADQAASLDPNLEPLRPWLGKTWKGEFKSSTPEKPVIDIARWERALNGKAVRILHSINQGTYGGESIVTWDAQQQALTYHYFTTAGFMTKGTMTVKDGKLLTHEVVQGSSQGVTEVRRDQRDSAGWHFSYQNRAPEERGVGAWARGDLQGGPRGAGGIPVMRSARPDLHFFGAGSGSGPAGPTWRPVSSSTRNQPRLGATGMDSPGFQTFSVCMPAMGGA